MKLLQLLDFASTMKTVGDVLFAVLILLVMITVHEFGHYIVGKIFKFRINEFSIGMGPAIFKRKKNGEQFSVRLFPLGGYCAFEGEDDEKDDPAAFNNKKPWQRILVLAAGATMNYLLALLVLIVSMSSFGLQAFQSGIVREDAAYEKSLSSGDYVLSLTVDGKKTNVYMATDLITALNHTKKGQTISVGILRDGKERTVPVTLRADVECNNLTEVDKTYDALGIGTVMHVEPIEGAALGGEGWFQAGDYILKSKENDEYTDDAFLFDAEMLRAYAAEKTSGDPIAFWISRGDSRVSVSTVLPASWDEVDKENAESVLSYLGIRVTDSVYLYGSGDVRLGFGEVLLRSGEYSVKIGGTIFRTLGELITGRLGINAMGGTVTTIVTTSKIVAYGDWRYIFELIALIGVNLAVVNLLPLPALDGSRIVFCAIEWIRKKPLNRKVEAIIHTIGLVLILGFAVLIDVLQFI